MKEWRNGPGDFPRLRALRGGLASRGTVHPIDHRRHMRRRRGEAIVYLWRRRQGRWGYYRVPSGRPGLSSTWRRLWRWIADVLLHAVTLWLVIVVPALLIIVLAGRLGAGR